MNENDIFLMSCNIIELSVSSSNQKMEPATVFIIGIGILLLAVTAYSIYMSFGAPSAELLDPFEEHED